jgi:hypothetical protein
MFFKKKYTLILKSQTHNYKKQHLNWMATEYLGIDIGGYKRQNEES